jgi:hypothetical protein
MRGRAKNRVRWTAKVLVNVRSTEGIHKEVLRQRLQRAEADNGR